MNWPQPTRPLRFGEFVALMALMMSSVAFSIDAMLPALPTIGDQLSPDAPQKGQLVITIFVLGLGLGTLICGPVSDAYGRKSVLLVGITAYITGALIAMQAQSIDGLLAARFLQGLGAAAPRVIATAMVRDMYEGRAMARVTSIIMTLFILVPAIAPSVGAVIIWIADWRAVFLAFVAFGLIGAAWLMLRQPESLPPERRRALSLRNIGAAVAEITTTPAVMIYVVALVFAFAPMFAWLSNLPMIFADVYDRAASFPLWFGITALVAGSASVVNAKLVMRLGMKRIATAAFLWQAVVSLLFLALLQFDLPAPWDFAFFFAFMCSAFFAIGLTFGNLNALALQPLGHMAGVGASVVQSLSTVGSVMVAIPISLAYNGTPIPLITGMALCACTALALMIAARRLAPELPAE
ncbi:Bicyclomycin resistance protein [Roseibaca ekhonensis]|jgi:DHA1 family bicyclomycin/chloramphenicol resistance-like MFS transporter|uniref:Bcr/CflA family efflux transporter n=1 Tax=Roseinatronobacter ekhonensis TaxID=254356 RepID=A0A3B0MP26_9RHOB|nr:multidrug effflux MFS transporter [Roseibaca ekhonensis]SUZ30664.1 Bicyclomycin resistance protein [Roseibaca ekhonensis]